MRNVASMPQCSSNAILPSMFWTLPRCLLELSLLSRTTALRRARLGARDLLLAQFEALQLAGLRLGKRVHELHRARVFVRGDDALHVILQRSHGRIVRVPLVAEDDVGLGDV